MGMPTMQNQQPPNQGKGVSPGNAGNPYMAKNSWQPIGSPTQPGPQIMPDQGALAARAASGINGVPSYAKSNMGMQPSSDFSDFNNVESDDFNTPQKDPYANQSFSQRIGGFQPQPQPQATSGKGIGSNITMPGQGGQPKMGQPNNYTNTVGKWDNARIWPQQSSQSSGGKGKGN